MATIALVDDDRNILTSVSIALESEGSRVETYTDGASALEGFAARPPNLAILDIKMPRMDGMELLRRLRQKSDLPVIFLTSKDEEIDELFSLKMGADDFITKPFSSEEFAVKVERLIAQRDVREKIKQIASRDYINPDENTVDFAVAFIPNEMIFSFIYEHLNDIWEEAMGKKVVLAGPYSFIALLRLVKQAHSNFRMQSNIHNVIQLVQKFRQEYDKFSEVFDKVGDRIEAARPWPTAP